MKKKVLLIASELGNGGAERSISLLSYHLSYTFDVTLCVMTKKLDDLTYKTCEKLIFIEPPIANNFFSKVKAWAYRIKAVKALKQQFKPDVVISFLEGPDYVNILSRMDEKIVLSIRGSKMYDQEITGVKGWIRKKFFIPYLYKKADCIVTVTQALAEEMNHFFKLPMIRLNVINNFYEVEEIVTQSKEKLTFEECQIFKYPVFINSGRLHIAKNQLNLIKAFSQIKQRKGTRLVILGEGPLEKILINHAIECGLRVCEWKTNGFIDADIYFMGFQKNPFKFYKSSNLFILTSSWEGFPNALTEALLCDIPVISTDCSTGPREILSTMTNDVVISYPNYVKHGILMPLLTNSKNIDLWTEQLQYFLNNDELSLRYKNCSAHLSKKYGSKNIVKKWVELINNL
jgi:glycosyltransferase involved in cell wall biosynthesis